MKVILKKQVEGLGESGDVIEVKPGYGRNFLIPKGFALLASSSNIKAVDYEKKMGALKKDKEKRSAEVVAKKLEGLSITIPVSVGEEDKLFGSVTAQNIADELEKNGITVDRRKIALDEPIKVLGIYDVIVKLHGEVEGKIKVWVVKE